MTQEEKDKTSGFEAARARLTSIAYRMLGSRAEAEDVVQDAWLKWHAAAESEFNTPLAWLTTVTTRLAIDRIRRLQSEQAARASECLIQPWLDEFAPSAEDEVLRASSVSEAVEMLFDRLSPDERAAFVLHEAFDFDYAQIAEVVGKTPAHCRQLAHRARQRLVSGQESGANAKRRDVAAAEASRAGSVEHLRKTLHGADAAGAMQLFADGEMAVAAAVSVVGGPLRVAAPLVDDASAFAEGAALDAYALPPDWGAALALARDCEIVGILRFVPTRTCAGGRIGHIEFATGGAEVDELNCRFGSRAIARLLARIAKPQSTASACTA
ncbi:sigma-70 family RNA polymerase sigma factor [Trinickia acidisoli]|uniref:sigma-70 family RNA polymerase sigma factor n=1 Tax=Trinickia acidisoli TaxID=2767482 RepID=UPI001A907BAF|nr:sigma-70 family RNA polymerase sigma factor [Trinickia acidisoli]